MRRGKRHTLVAVGAQGVRAVDPEQAALLIEGKGTHSLTIGNG